MSDVKPGSERVSGTFQVIPAIDLRGGRVVRLRQGDFDRETRYGDDPAAVAAGFADAGAEWVHVVDLDGARAGSPQQLAIVAGIVAAVAGRLRVECGGGLRREDDVTRLLDLGVDRAVLGTSALADPDLLGRLVERQAAERIAVALDVRDGLAVGDGWRPGATGTPIPEAVDRVLAAGVDTLEVTAVGRDGGLEGPDLELLEHIVRTGSGRVIASGGIRSIDDLLAARRLGCVGAIVGRALYEGRLDLRAAVRATRPERPTD